MIRVIFAVLLTLIGGFLFATWEQTMGIIAAIAIMGGFILNELQNNK